MLSSVTIRVTPQDREVINKLTLKGEKTPQTISRILKAYQALQVLIPTIKVDSNESTGV